MVDGEGRTPNLACPGSAGCADADGELLAGAAAIDITPVLELFEDQDGDLEWDVGEPFDDVDGDGEHDEVWVAGFSPGRPAFDVHDPLWARAVVLSKGASRVGLVVVDVVGYWHDEIIRIRTEAERRGLELDEVIVASTHNHEGPDTMGGWGMDPFTSGKDPAYMDRVVDSVVTALAEATAVLAPAELRIAQGDATGWIHDSRLPEVIDPTVTVMQIVGDEPIASITVFGNHAEALGGSNRRITSDYPHYLRARMEDALGGVALYLPGTLGGLMNPLHVVGCPDADGNAGCDTGTFEKAQWLGEGVAEIALEALADATIDDDPDLGFRRRSFLMGVDNGLFITGFIAKVLERSVYGRDGRRLNEAEIAAVSFEEARSGAVRVQTEVAGLRLGPSEILFVPGELYPELWLQAPDGSSLVTHPEGADYPDAAAEPALRTFLPPADFEVIVNQANDALGYIIPKAQFDRMAPRAYEEDGQYGEENSTGPDTARVISEQVDALYSQ